MRKSLDGRASMEETHGGPTTIVASEQDTNRHSHDGEQARIKLNAQVMIKKLQNMHKKSLPPTGARRRMELEYQGWARLQA